MKLKEIENKNRTTLFIAYKFKIDIHTTNYHETFYAINSFWGEGERNDIKEDFKRHINDINDRLKEKQCGYRRNQNTFKYDPTSSFIIFDGENDQKIFNLQHVSYFNISDFEEILHEEWNSGKYYKLEL